MENENLTNVTLTNEKTQKKNTGILIGIIAGVFVLIAVAVVCILLFCTTIFLSPKQKVMLAFSKAFGADNVISIISGNKNVKSSGNFIPYNGISLKDYQTIRESMKEGGSQVALDVKLTDIKYDDVPEAKMAKGASLSMDFMSDIENRKVYGEIVAKYMAINLIKSKLYIDDADVSLALDDYFDGYITVNTETLSKDYNKSDLCDEVGEEMPKVSFNLFDIISEYQDIQMDYSQFTDEAGEAMQITKKFYDSIEVTETGAKEKFEVGGKDISCKEYKIDISKKDMKKFAEEYEDLVAELTKEYYLEYLDFLESNINIDSDELDFDELREEFEDDFDDEISDMFDEFNDTFCKDYTFYVYLDNKCRLIDFFYEDSYEDSWGEEYDIALDMTWHGKENLFDDFDGSLIVKGEENSGAIYFANTGSTDNGNRTDEFIIEITPEDDDEIVTATLNRQRDKDGAFTYNLLIEHPSTDESIEFNIEGTETLTKEFYELNIEDISMNCDLDDQEFSLGFEIFYSIGTLLDEIPEPKGPEYKLFKMSIDDLEDLIEEIEDNIENSKLGDIF